MVWFGCSFGEAAVRWTAVQTNFPDEPPTIENVLDASRFA